MVVIATASHSASLALAGDIEYCTYAKELCTPSLKDPKTGEVRTYDLSTLCTDDGVGYQGKSKVSDLGHTWTGTYFISSFCVLSLR